MYTVDSTTGALTAQGTANGGSGMCPSSIAVHPSGRFVYVTDLGDLDSNFGTFGVSPYSVDAATGKLTLVGLADTGPACPASMAFDPSGKFAYVADECSNNVLMYTVNPTTGALTLLGTIGT
jgi:6-phosphogluconolactonase (cycloisomerase 2 family)